MLYDSSQVVERLRDLVAADVPFLHQGRDFQGIDCVGALAYGFQYTGNDIPNYPENPINGELERELNRIFGPAYKYRFNLLDPSITRDELQEKDILSIQYRGPVRHVAVVVNHRVLPGQLSMIHTDYAVGKVVEHILDERWLRRIVGVWRP